MSQRITKIFLILPLLFLTTGIEEARSNPSGASSPQAISCDELGPRLRMDAKKSEKQFLDGVKQLMGCCEQGHGASCFEYGFWMDAAGESKEALKYFDKACQHKVQFGCEFAKGKRGLPEAQRTMEAANAPTCRVIVGKENGKITYRVIGVKAPGLPGYQDIGFKGTENDCVWHISEHAGDKMLSMDEKRGIYTVEE